MKRRLLQHEEEAAKSGKASETTAHESRFIVMSRQLTTMHSMIGGALFVAVVLAPMLYFDTHEQVFNVLQWLESQAV